MAQRARGKEKGMHYCNAHPPLPETLQQHATSVLGNQWCSSQPQRKGVLPHVQAVQGGEDVMKNKRVLRRKRKNGTECECIPGQQHPPARGQSERTAQLLHARTKVRINHSSANTGGEILLLSSSPFSSFFLLLLSSFSPSPSLFTLLLRFFLLSLSNSSCPPSLFSPSPLYTTQSAAQPCAAWLPGSACEGRRTGDAAGAKACAAQCSVLCGRAATVYAIAPAHSGGVGPCCGRTVPPGPVAGAAPVQEEQRQARATAG